MVGAAAALGTLTGVVVLPDRATTPGPDPVPVSTPYATTTAAPSPTATPSRTAVASPSEARPLTSEDLLGTADFRSVGLEVTPQSADVRMEPVTCTEHESLDEIAASGPPVQGRWEAGTVVASEQAVAARDVEEAAEVAKTVRITLEGCQDEAPGHWVYGPTHTEKLGATVEASWLGTVDGELNTTGRAPKGEKISAGVAVVRNGVRVAVFDISWCASTGDSPACLVAGPEAYGQLAELSRTAARRLG